MQCMMSATKADMHSPEQHADQQRTQQAPAQPPARSPPQLAQQHRSTRGPIALQHPPPSRQRLLSEHWQHRAGLLIARLPENRKQCMLAVPAWKGNRRQTYVRACQSMHVHGLCSLPRRPVGRPLTMILPSDIIIDQAVWNLISLFLQQDDRCQVLMPTSSLTARHGYEQLSA